MRVVVLGIYFLLLAATPLCALTLAGTGDSEMILQRLATEYHRLYPDRIVEVLPSVGSSGGIRMLLQGRTDLARVARPLTAGEARQGLVWHKFAVVPIVFVANLSQRCISDLTSKQLLSIFDGQNSRWSQLGTCPDEKIYLARRESGDSSNRILYALIPGLRAIEHPVGKTIYTTQETFDTIEAHPYTLGYLPLSQLTGSNLVQFSIDGIQASPTTIDNGTYALHLPLALAWKGPLREDVRHFLLFLNSPAAQALIGSYGAVPTSGQDM